MKRFSLKELQSMKTISVGQVDDLKFDDGYTRVWLSRCKIEDGEPYNNKVTLEEWKDGRWLITDTYQAI